MNDEIFNELVDVLGEVVGTFRSVATFPSDTKPLLDSALQVIERLKFESPRPLQEELL